MKRRLLTLIICILSLSAHAQEVVLRINGGITDTRLKVSAEGNISALLSSINRSQAEQTVDLSGVWISDEAADELRTLWAEGRFHCLDNIVVEKAIRTYEGNMQVRNLPMSVSYENGNSYQEMVVDFDKDGKIIKVKYSVNADLYRKLIASESSSEELRKRQMILSYVEQFRTAYTLKDLEFMEQIFSDDALIITGKVIRRAASDLRIMPSEKISYSVFSKSQYLDHLKKVFANASHIDVDFSDIKISRHPTKSDYYGVVVHQGYSSDIYSDDGYIFLLWDFSDEYSPKIHVRTWQPYWTDEFKTMSIKASEIIDINSFIL